VAVTYLDLSAIVKLALPESDALSRYLRCRQPLSRALLLAPRTAVSKRPLRTPPFRAMSPVGQRRLITAAIRSYRTSSSPAIRPTHRSTSAGLMSVPAVSIASMSTQSRGLLKMTLQTMR